MEKLPEKQRRQVLEEQLQPLKRLVKFGVDPNIKDLNGYNALDYAKFIKNPELLSHTLEILK